MALVEADGAVVSGEGLAAATGVSRAAVAKHIAALRAAGFGVSAEPGAGYQLTVRSESLDPLAVRAWGVGPRWVELLGGGTTASTMDDAGALAREGAPDGTVVLSERQTGGRGRLGRMWTSPPGGVYLSMVLRPSIGLEAVPTMPLVVSLGVARGLEELGIDARLKWPNDASFDGRKLGGVLLEMAAEADRVSWIVAGIGVNVLAEEERVEAAAYVGDSAHGISRPRVAAVLLAGIDETLGRFEGEGFVGVRRLYESRLDTLGRDVVVRDLDGVVRVEGTASGIDEIGRLKVDGPGGPIAVSSGDVTLKPLG